MQIPAKIDFTPCYFGNEGFLPEIEFVGMNIHTRRNPQKFGVHKHAKCWEICLLIRGLMQWWIEGEMVTLRAGDIFITSPNEPHSGVDVVMHRCEVCYLGIVLPPTAALPGLSREHNGVIASGFAQIHNHHFPALPVVMAAFSALMAEGEKNDPQRLIIARGCLHQLLAGVLRSYHEFMQSGKRKTTTSPAVHAAQIIMKDHAASPISVAELARMVGLSRGLLHQKFVNDLGLSPGEYLTRLRIEKSKELLIAGEKTGKLAEQLGFASPQHFSTVFKKTTGMTPRAWRSRQEK